MWRPSTRLPSLLETQRPFSAVFSLAETTVTTSVLQDPRCSGSDLVPSLLLAWFQLTGTAVEDVLVQVHRDVSTVCTRTVSSPLMLGRTTVLRLHVERFSLE